MRTKILVLLALVILLSLALPMSAAFAGSGKEDGTKLKLVGTVSDAKSLKLDKGTMKPGGVITPNASLPNPGGGSISWNVASVIGLFDNGVGGHSANCTDKGNTSQSVFRLYLGFGEFTADGSLKASVNGYNGGAHNVSSYAWVTATNFGNFGTSFFECIGEHHSAEVTSTSPVYMLDTRVTKSW